MFDVFKLLFAWLPSPLDAVLFGFLCILLVIAVVKLVAWVIDLIPFL